jgi:hypothetical protein
VFRSALIITISFVLLAFVAPAARAEIISDVLPIAVSLPVFGTNIRAGQIVTVDLAGQYVIASREYDPNILGVVVETAALSLSNQADTATTYLVASSGQVLLLVDSSSGAIKVGDFITTSSQAGYGMKALKPGVVVGQALQPFGTDDDKTASGQILVDVNPKFFPGVLGGQNTAFFTMLGSSLLALFSKNQLAFLEQSAKVIKAVIAALIALISIILSFINFGKAARSGIEASGRNPLAGKLITASITLNIALTIIAGVFGVALAYLIFVI